MSVCIFVCPCTMWAYKRNLFGIRIYNLQPQPYPRSVYFEPPHPSELEDWANITKLQTPSLPLFHIFTTSISQKLSECTAVGASQRWKKVATRLVFFICSPRLFLSVPGIPGVRSMDPSLSKYKGFLKQVMQVMQVICKLCKLCKWYASYASNMQVMQVMQVICKLCKLCK